MAVNLSNFKGCFMLLSSIKSMCLIGGNILLLLCGLMAINIFMEKKYFLRAAKFLWVICWGLLMCIFMNNELWIFALLKDILFIVYFLAALALIGFFILVRKIRRIYIMCYDFFLFLKSRVFVSRPGVAHTFSSKQLIEFYLNLIVKYIVFLEFLKTSRPRQIKDKFINFVLNFSTYGGVFCMFNEIFADEVYKFDSKTVSPKIIDCGSNIGLSILYFKSLYPQAKIIGFEPGLETYDLLRKNVEENNLRDVVVHNKALSDKEGFIPFYVSKENPAHGGWSIGGEANDYYKKSETQIPCARLSAYIDSEVDLLKIDIEGAEDLVVKDLAENGKLKFVKQIILEYHHHMVNLQQDNLSKTLAFFEENNFGYQFNFVEKPTNQNHMRNTLIIRAYNKNFS